MADTAQPQRLSVQCVCGGGGGGGGVCGAMRVCGCDAPGGGGGSVWHFRSILFRFVRGASSCFAGGKTEKNSYRLWQFANRGWLGSGLTGGQDAQDADVWEIFLSVRVFVVGE